MQCAIREHNEGESPGLKVGFWFDNTHMEYLSVEYFLKIIVDYCIEAVNSGQRTQYLAISVWIILCIDRRSLHIMETQNWRAIRCSWTWSPTTTLNSYGTMLQLHIITVVTICTTKRVKRRISALWTSAMTTPSRWFVRTIMYTFILLCNYVEKLHHQESHHFSKCMWKSCSWEIRESIFR